MAYSPNSTNLFGRRALVKFLTAVAAAGMAGGAAGAAFASTPGRPEADAQLLARWREYGMRSNVADWTSIARLDDHPMIFVARGTHGLYFSDQDEALIISGADDPSVRNCGRNEGVAAFESDQGNRMRSC
jgi:hypothetical protein